MLCKFNIKFCAPVPPSPNFLQQLCVQDGPFCCPAALKQVDFMQQVLHACLHPALSLFLCVHWALFINRNRWLVVSLMLHLAVGERAPDGPAAPLSCRPASCPAMPRLASAALPESKHPAPSLSCPAILSVLPPPPFLLSFLPLLYRCAAAAGEAPAHQTQSETL